MSKHTVGKTEFTIEPGRHDVTITRFFDAPREAVFKALTDPDLVPQWWGPARYATKVERADFRPGGSWRFISGDGEAEYPFHGVFHEVSPERIVQTSEFEGAPGHVSLETLTLEEVDGGTRYTAVAVFQTVEARDAMTASGMDEGAAEGMDRLAALVEKA
ncbi:SRPBCC family protein [Nocardiopsis potens]|uniref:SRPBCC family protein n=1 Tax=Nocardiopsis potens TaxID=1246458 RepID=UPI00034A98C5|nr:SRPBCC family protein [Nocardiopsis potens]